MRKRQRTKKKKGNAGRRNLDSRDRDWLTSDDQFAASVSKSDEKRTKRRGQLQSAIKQTDVSLHEYADNPRVPATSRVSKAKGVTTVLHKEAKMEASKKKDEDSVVDDWFLQDDSDYEYQECVEEDTTQDAVGCDGLDISVGQQDKADASEPAHEGMEYPADIWYILSNYISPLQVGCFAAICKDAYMVTNTAAFWKNLYQRFYNADAKLPVQLQPVSMLRIYGIRALVIRALHMMYTPYVSHIKSLPPIAEGIDSPDNLLNRTCLYMWSRGQVGCHFYHFFKFRDEDLKPEISHCYNNEEVLSNPHTDECILKVFCQNFQHFPSDEVMGSKLVKVGVSVSSNFRYHRLKLQFTKGSHRGLPRESNLLTVVLDPVILIRVLHWWHPQFQESLNQGVFGTSHSVSVASAIWEGRV
ncbi:transmembrane protein 183-like isoform X2 [Amphiura filiformis]|uniref:transmembrane protein 183-like isoform X2 n=1 Tax=Amphiura filiformis TaxID=82378 RepID=UPI003B215503